MTIANFLGNYRIEISSGHGSPPHDFLTGCNSRGILTGPDNTYNH